MATTQSKWEHVQALASPFSFVSLWTTESNQGWSLSPVNQEHGSEKPCECLVQTAAPAVPVSHAWSLSFTASLAAYRRIGHSSASLGSAYLRHHRTVDQHRDGLWWDSLWRLFCVTHTQRCTPVTLPFVAWAGMCGRHGKLSSVVFWVCVLAFDAFLKLHNRFLAYNPRYEYHEAFPPFAFFLEARDESRFSSPPGGAWTLAATSQHVGCASDDEHLLQRLSLGQFLCVFARSVGLELCSVWENIHTSAQAFYGPKESFFERWMHTVHAVVRQDFTLRLACTLEQIRCRSFLCSTRKTPHTPRRAWCHVWLQPASMCVSVVSVSGVNNTTINDRAVFATLFLSRQTSLLRFWRRWLRLRPPRDGLPTRIAGGLAYLQGTHLSYRRLRYCERLAKGRHQFAPFPSLTRLWPESRSVFVASPFWMASLDAGALVWLKRRWHSAPTCFSSGIAYFAPAAYWQTNKVGILFLPPKSWPYCLPQGLAEVEFGSLRDFHSWRIVLLHVRGDRRVPERLAVLRQCWPQQWEVMHQAVLQQHKLFDSQDMDQNLASFALRLFCSLFLTLDLLDPLVCARSRTALGFSGPAMACEAHETLVSFWQNRLDRARLRACVWPQKPQHHPDLGTSLRRWVERGVAWLLSRCYVVVVAPPASVNASGVRQVIFLDTPNTKKGSASIWDCTYVQHPESLLDAFDRSPSLLRQRLKMSPREVTLVFAKSAGVAGFRCTEKDAGCWRLVPARVLPDAFEDSVTRILREESLLRLLTHTW